MSNALPRDVTFLDNILHMYFGFNVKSLSLPSELIFYTTNVYAPLNIYITNKFSFIVRRLHFVCIRSVLKLKYER